MFRFRLTLSPQSPNRRLCCLVVVACCLALKGCDAPIDAFKPNLLLAAKLEKSQGVDLQAAVADSSAALETLFGTPDKPIWPDFLKDDQLAKLVDVDRLSQAAGAVRSDEQDRHFGLFREHCVACHGVTGDGAGPASRLLSPYPRDFRLGKFKFKSTPIGKKPTRADLRRILVAGLPGTSMPSFRLLNDEELETLVDYVIYLSVRGEVERQLLTEAAIEVDYSQGERLFDVSLKDENPEKFNGQWSLLETTTKQVNKQWAEADASVTPVKVPHDYPVFSHEVALSGEGAQRLAASVENGRKLFAGPIANCVSCHGATAMGDGQTNNYDAWTKDWLEGLDPQNRDEIRPMLKLGALKPQRILPRNLRTGIYRGGSEPNDLYLRIVNGIEGTPMPATPLQPANPQGLTENEVWDLVNFLLSLPHEVISKDAGITPQTKPLEPAKSSEPPESSEGTQ